MSHYFDIPEGPEKRREISATIWDHDLSLQTANGVFSGYGLDLATRVLLRSHRPDPGARRVLDLGCGWGPIALGLALALPAAVVDAVDVNPRALALTADNAARCGVGDRVHAMLPEQVDPAVRYDEIWSNPPIRIGKEALHALLLQWLPRLQTTGVARLVVGRNLGADSLQQWLIEQGHPTRRTASAKGFRVLEVRPSSAATP